jgi:predicted Zn-dependent protease
MQKLHFRSVTAFVLAMTLWLTAVSASAASLPQAQKKDGQQPATQTASTQNPSSTAAPLRPAATKNAGKALSTDEDPAMIGKRKIGGGFFAWLGGSQSKEVAIGRQLSAEVEKQSKMIDDPMVTEYINRVGQNIVLHSDAKVAFTIKVIDADEVNAFALPGGFFYVNKGLILAADNESELAGVMAHEIGHVAARHAMRNQGKMTMLNYGLFAGMILTGGIGGAVIQNTAGLAEALAFTKFSRDSESEADRLGAQYAYASGYDPHGMATMFEKLEAQNKKKPGFFAKTFATHPQPPDRRDSTLSLIARFPEREEYVVSTSEFQRVKNRLFKMSNARAVRSSDPSLDGGGSDGGPPTLKRRTPAGDDPSATPTESTPADPPKLKRNDGQPPANQTSPPPTNSNPSP